MEDLDFEDIGRADFMKVKIISPEDVVFEGEIKALELENEIGPFSIFPYHETFITIIKSKMIVFDKSERQHEFPIEHGIIKVYLNKIEIFLGLQFSSPDDALKEKAAKEEKNSNSS